MGLANKIYLSQNAAREFSTSIGCVNIVSGRCILVGLRDREEIFVYDSDLVLQRIVPARLQWRNDVDVFFDMNLSNGLIAFCDQNRFGVMNLEGRLFHTVSHSGWSAFGGCQCRFLANDNKICFVQPTEKTSTSDLFTVYDVDLDRIFYQCELPIPPAQIYDLYCHPIIPVMFVNATYSLNTLGCCIEFDDSDMRIQHRPMKHRFFGDFSPTKSELVSLPDDVTGGTVVQFHSLPDCEILASIDDDSVFADDPLAGTIHVEQDHITSLARYCGPDKVLVFSDSGRIVVLNRSDLSCLGSIKPEGCIWMEKLEGSSAKDTRGRICDYWVLADNRMLIQYKDLFFQVLDLRNSVLELHH